MNLMGGSLQYDIDLSQSHCSCNAALYVTRMPGVKEDGSPDPSSGSDYYCDSNGITGNFCPDVDIMEANQYAWAIKSNTCDKPNDKGHYPNC